MKEAEFGSDALSRVRRYRFDTEGTQRRMCGVNQWGKSERPLVCTWLHCITTSPSDSCMLLLEARVYLVGIDYLAQQETF